MVTSASVLKEKIEKLTEHNWKYHTLENEKDQIKFVCDLCKDVITPKSSFLEHEY